MSEHPCLICGNVTEDGIEVDYDSGGLSGFLCGSHTLAEVATARQAERDIDGDECYRFALGISEGYFKVSK